MNIDFKIAREEDIREILIMMEQFYAIDNYPFDKEKTHGNLLAFIADPNLGRAWVITSDDFIIGYIVLAYGYSFERGGRDAFIDELFLKTAFRRKGIGKLAMDFIKNEAPKLGIHAIHLEVEPHNTGGLKLYLEKGFMENGRILMSKEIDNGKIEL